MNSQESETFASFEQRISDQFPYREVGRIEEVIGLVIESRGPKARIGDLCHIYSDQAQPLPAEVVGL